MRHIFFFSIILFSCIQNITAQNNIDYNIKGDQSLAKSDYLDACMWYGEGIEQCDNYSIHQLTKIWNDQISVRTSVSVLMSKSRACLEKKAISNDTESMFLLSEYYEKGIGTEIDLIQSELWKKKALSYYLDDKSTEVKQSVVDTIRYIETTQPESITRKLFYADFEYFLMYTPSYTMPAGITFGVWNDSKLGGYLSFKSNLRFEKIVLECNNENIPNKKDTNYFLWDDERWSNYMLTAGILYPVIRNLSVSLGLGYAKRDIFWHATQYDYVSEIENTSYWYHNTQSSYKGVALELGALYRTNKFIFSGGCNTISFKDIDVFVGVGYIFN